MEGSAFPSPNNRQGELQTAQSVAVLKVWFLRYEQCSEPALQMPVG